MKKLKAALSLLLLSSVSALADDTASTGSTSSLPMITAITSGAKPAVDGLNGKAEFFGGAAQANASNGGSLPYMATTQPHKIDGSNLWYGTGGAAGTISIPVGHSFGIQVDALSGLYTNAYTGGGAGHFFWRDPDKGLVGVYGSGLYSALNKGSGTWQAAGEAELYYGHITIGGLVGIQGYTNNYYNNLYDAILNPIHAISNPGFYSNTNPNRFYDDVAVSFYPFDDLRLAVGHLYSHGRNGVTLQGEYLLPQFRGGPTAVSTFVEGVVGTDNNSIAMAGIKIYFGNHDKTLIRRHREDDPSMYGKRHLPPPPPAYLGTPGQTANLERLVQQNNWDYIKLFSYLTN